MRNPYVIGPYVSGRKHYGRQSLIETLLHSEASAHWVIGSRRVGKTSLLRQLEALALSEAHCDRYLPIFWDMQGCNTFASLGAYLVDALQERLDQARQCGLAEEAMRDENLLTLLPTLRRAARSAGRELLLLCDETEVLINIADAEPELTQRLHAELTRGAGLRVIAVSTRRIYDLHEVCKPWPTSPFLAGFDMSQSLGSLERAEAQALVVQAQADEPVQAAPEVIEAICDLTNCHPYLVQLLCSRLFQPEGYLRPVEPADLVVDPLLGGFLGNDFSLLSPAEQQLILAVHAQGQADIEALAAAMHQESLAVQTTLREITPLGYLRRQDGRWVIGNHFLAQWLTASGSGGPAREPSPSAGGPPTQDQPPAAAARVAPPLAEQLNVRRERLMELELIRARELLSTPSAVLAEIRQLEQEIQQLLSLAGGNA